MTGVLHPDDALDDFEAERPRLVGLAYRITGSRTVAEDLVQDAWLRWERADHAAIERPAAWLTTVTSRLALDHLKSAQHTRETYVGPWLPEPTITEPDPADRVELAESLTLGFLAVLERLGPVERVVFLLADVFSVPFDEIAATVDKTPEACRQIASRARQRVRDGRPRFSPTDDQAWEVALAFLTAAQVGDIDALVSLLAPEAVLVSDGGAEHHAARRPVVAEKIPRFVVNIARRWAEAGVGTYEMRLANNQPTLVLVHRDTVLYSFTVSVSNGLINHIASVINPAKLQALSDPPIA
jgi:RNA polymerase sigma-70 factor (ECF subfamily)